MNSSGVRQWVLRYRVNNAVQYGTHNVSAVVIVAASKRDREALYFFTLRALEKLAEHIASCRCPLLHICVQIILLHPPQVGHDPQTL